MWPRLWRRPRPPAGLWWLLRVTEVFIALILLLCPGKARAGYAILFLPSPDASVYRCSPSPEAVVEALKKGGPSGLLGSCKKAGVWANFSLPYAPGALWADKEKGLVVWANKFSRVCRSSGKCVLELVTTAARCSLSLGEGTWLVQIETRFNSDYPVSAYPFLWRGKAGVDSGEASKFGVRQVKEGRSWMGRPALVVVRFLPGGFEAWLVPPLLLRGMPTGACLLEGKQYEKLYRLMQGFRQAMVFRPDLMIPYSFLVREKGRIFYGVMDSVVAGAMAGRRFLQFLRDSGKEVFVPPRPGPSRLTFTLWVEGGSE